MSQFQKASPNSVRNPHATRSTPILRRLGLLGAVLLLGLLLVPVSARADGNNVAKGKQLFSSKRCADCHGANGRTPHESDYPVIAGQSADYLDYALTAYKTGARSTGAARVHVNLFKSLSYSNLQQLADYIATMK